MDHTARSPQDVLAVLDFLARPQTPGFYPRCLLTAMTISTGTSDSKIQDGEDVEVPRSLAYDSYSMWQEIETVRRVLNFGPEKCLKESKVTCGVSSKRQVWSTFFLFEFFDHVSKGKFGPHSKCSKRQVCSIFGEKSGPNLPFRKHLPHVIQTIRKRQVWSRFFSEYGANLPFRAIWMWTKLAFWHVIKKFEEKKKWTKLAFSSLLHTWLWTPSNTFLDQNLRR